MKLGIVGSREFYDYIYFLECMEQFKFDKISCIISGGAKGAAAFAAKYAKDNGIPLVEYIPDYAKHGNGAPFKRNARIVDESDIIVAFWNCESRGTKNTISKAKKINKQVIIFVIEKV